MTEEKGTGTTDFGGMPSILEGMGVPSDILGQMGTPAEAAAPVVEAAPVPVVAPVIEAVPAQVVAPVVEAAPAVVEPVATPETTPAVEAAPVVEPVVEESPESAFSATITSDIYGGEKTFGKADEPTDPLLDKNFENIDSLGAYLKKDHGIDSIADLPTQIQQWKENGGKVEELSTKVNNANAVFENMHPDLYQAVMKDRNGQDWRSEISKNNLDLTKNAVDFKVEDIVNAMSPGELTAEDWEQYNDREGDPTVRRLVERVIKSSEASFEVKKQAFDTARNNTVTSNLRYKEDFTASVSAAGEEMKKQMENASPAYIAQMQELFTKNTINSLFYDEKGMLKPDALVRAGMANDGKALVDQWEGIARNKAETKVNTEILSRGASVPAVPQRSAAVQQADEISQEVKDVEATIRRMGGQPTY